MALDQVERSAISTSRHELPQSVENLQGGLVYLIPTVHWLHDISEEYRKNGYSGPDFTLGTIPDAEWIKLRDKGVDLIYFMGVFQRDDEARKFAHRWKHQYEAASPPDYNPQEDIVGSAFAHVGYEHLDRHVVDPMRDWEEFDAVAKKLERLGIGVGVDYIPNHTGIGHEKVGTDHQFYITGTREEFQAAPGRFIDTFLGDMNADRPFHDEHSEEYHIYHGWFEGAEYPWEDTAQINLANEQVQEYMIEEVARMVREHHVSMLRFDMVHLTLRSTFEKSWGWKFTEEQMKTLETFWPRLIQRAKSVAASQGRELVCIAEAYWGEEEILNAGFDFVYGSEFYNREHKIAKGEETAESIEWYLRNGWNRRRFIRYQENHDEHRAASNEGLRGDAQSRAFATVSAMSDEGMWMVFAGQEEARITRPPVHTRRTRDESGDGKKVRFNTMYYDRLFSWRQSELFRKGVYSIPSHKPERDESYKQLVVQQKATATEGRISVVNLSNNNYGRCLIQLPEDIDVDSIEVYEWNTGERVLPIATPLRRGDDPNHLYLSVMIRGPWRGQYITFKKK